MKILMISDFYPPFVGGVEIAVTSLSRELVLRGHSVAVATLGVPGSESLELANGIRVHRITTTVQRSGRLFASSARPWAPPAPDPEAVSSLRAVVKRERPEIVHGHDWLARSYLPLKRRGHGPALVMSLHYYTLSCPKKNLMYLEAPCSGPALAKCLRCAGRHYGGPKGAGVTLAQMAFSRLEARRVDLFLPVSTATAEGNGLHEAGLAYEVVPNFVGRPLDPAPFRRLLDDLPEDPFLLFVGDVRRDKGIQVLLEAYALMRSPPPLVLIGKVWPDTPREFPAGVRLLRNWPNAAVRAAMRRCLALVVPSLWPEPFGIVAAEALAAGRPVIASAIGGIPGIVRHEQEGLLVAPGDASALCAAMRALVSDTAKRDRMSAAALTRARDYTPEVVIPMFERAYGRARLSRP